MLLAARRDARLGLYGEEIRGGEREQEQKKSFANVRTPCLITLHVSMPHKPSAWGRHARVSSLVTRQPAVSAHGAYVAGHRRPSSFGREPGSLLKFPRLLG